MRSLQIQNGNRTSKAATGIAVLFHRLGPYHFARLRETAQQLSVTAVEFSRVDNTYAWEEVAGAEGFQRITLFDDADSHSYPAAEVAARTQAALETARPSAVAIPGWSDPAALAALRWCLAKQVPAVMMSETTAWDEQRQPWREWIKQRVVQLCASALVGGRPHKEYLVQLGMPARHVFFNYDAVDNAHFRQAAERASQQTDTLRNRLTLPERYFLASARFIEKKNLPRLLTAYARYRQMTDRAGAWDLVLLGDGEMRPQLEALATELGIQGAVQMPGFKQYQELPAYYGLASAFVHASTVEQWGLVVNEAMASGLPVLVSNCCGCAADLVREGHNGFTFDPYDTEQLAQLFLRISQMSAAERQTMGQHSQQLIAAWGPEAFAAGMQQAVKAALSHPRPRAGWLDRLLLEMLIRR